MNDRFGAPEASSVTPKGIGRLRLEFSSKKLVQILENREIPPGIYQPGYPGRAKRTVDPRDLKPGTV